MCPFLLVDHIQPCFQKHYLKQDLLMEFAGGEGEFALLEVVDKLNRGEEYRSVSNFWFRNKDEIIRNEVRPLIDDLDALPMADCPARGLLEEQRREPVVRPISPIPPHSKRLLTSSE